MCLLCLYEAHRVSDILLGLLKVKVLCILGINNYCNVLLPSIVVLGGVYMLGVQDPLALKANVHTCMHTYKYMQHACLHACVHVFPSLHVMCTLGL